MKAQIARIVLHTAGIPFGRTLTFAVGWAGMIIIFLQILGG